MKGKQGSHAGVDIKTEEPGVGGEDEARGLRYPRLVASFLIPPQASIAR